MMKSIIGNVVSRFSCNPSLWLQAFRHQKDLFNRKLNHWYEDLNLGKKLLLINSITAGTAMILLMLSIAGIYTKAQRDQLLEHTEVQAKILVEQLTSSFYHADNNTLQDSLKSSRNSPYVQHVVLYDVQKNTASEYIKNQYPVNAPSKQDFAAAQKLGTTYQFNLYSLRYLTLIKINRQEMGYLYFESIVTPVYKKAAVFIFLSLLAAGYAAAVGLLLLNRLQRPLMLPLNNLVGLMEEVSQKNDYTKRYDLNTNDEMGKLARGFNQMLAKIEERDSQLGTQIKEKEKSEKRLNRLAHYDVITHLPNRHYFNQRLAIAAAQQPPEKLKFALMFIDLDNFKVVNDIHGHQLGDVLLQRVAELLKTSVRADDVVARLGGDEFGVLLPDLERLEDASVVARKIIKNISAPMVLNGKKVVVGASIGISFFPTDASNIELLMQNADSSMYHAKNQGKNNFQFFNQELRTRAQYRNTIEAQLGVAIEENQLYLEYQPQFDLKTRQIYGAEALLRWKHPKRGLVSPNEFIPVAEESGLIVLIGEWVLRQACLQAKIWREHGHSLVVAVNVSSYQFRDTNMVQRFENIFTETGVDPAWIELELTESALIDANENTLKKLYEFANKGLKLAIDDFGTGYSSLSYLKRFPISKLKIDRSFIVDVESDREDKAIVEAIIAMGRSLGMQVIAEGIENEQQAQILQALNCPQGQGFLVSCAVKPDKILEVMKLNNLA